MVRVVPDLVPADAIIVPVPLHRWRLWRRRYNQSAMLAIALSRARGMVYAPDLLIRKRATASQAGQNARDRRRNVRGAFDVRSHRAAELADRHVLLIDDVMTTGATVRECARALKRAGAATVTVAVVARAVMPSRID
jgi:ComF family protein